MNISKSLLMLSLAALPFSQPLLAYEPPTDEQIAKMLANPKLINRVLEDANGEEAAVLVDRVITRIQGSGMGPKQKNYLIAFYTAQVATLLNDEDAESFAQALVASVNADALPIVLAGLSTGRGGSNDFTELLNELAGDNEALQVAILTPNIPLTDPVYELLLANLETIQSRPPQVIDSLLPPPEGPGGGTDNRPVTPPPSQRPPVVPPPYQGQG